MSHGLWTAFRPTEHNDQIGFRCIVASCAPSLKAWPPINFETLEICNLHLLIISHMVRGKTKCHWHACGFVNELKHFYIFASFLYFFPMNVFIQTFVHFSTELTFFSFVFCTLFFFKSSFEDIFIDSKEKEKRRERQTDREKHWYEKHRSVASSKRPYWGLNSQPRHVPRPGIETLTFLVYG